MSDLLELDSSKQEGPLTSFNDLKKEIEQKYDGARATIIIFQDSPNVDQGAIYTAGDIHEPIYLASIVKPVFAAAALHMAEGQGIPYSDPIQISEDRKKALTEELSLKSEDVNSLTLEQTINYALGPSSNVALNIIKDWINTRFNTTGDPSFASNAIQDYAVSLLKGELGDSDFLFTIRGSEKEKTTKSPNCATALEIFSLARLILLKDKKLGISEDALDLIHRAMQNGNGDKLLELSNVLKDDGDLKITDKSGTYPDFESHESPLIADLYGLEEGSPIRCMQLSSFALVQTPSGNNEVVFYHIGVPYTQISDSEKPEELPALQSQQQIDLEKDISQNFVEKIAALV